MDKLRGLIHFEGRNLNDLKLAFKDFKLEGVKSLKYGIFYRIDLLGKDINRMGIIIDMDLSISERKETFSQEIIKSIRKKMQLSEEIKNCDVSSTVCGEDYINYLKKGELHGTYLGVRILPPYNDSNLAELASELARVIGAEDIMLRGVEKIEFEGHEVPKRCVDLTGEFDFHAKRAEIERHLMSHGVKLEGYTIFEIK